MGEKLTKKRDLNHLVISEVDVCSLFALTHHYV